jgi:serine protease Do
MVADVEPNSPAYRAGIRVNDVVRRWNDQEVVNYSSLYRFVDMTEPDTKASVELLRDGELYQVEITVGSRDEFERRREFQR